MTTLRRQPSAPTKPEREVEEAFDRIVDEGCTRLVRRSRHRNFLVPVTAAVAGQGRMSALARIWGVTLVANLVGGWLIVSLIVTGLPELDALGNLVGGLVLVTAIRLLRVPHRVAEARGAVLQ